MYIVVYASKNTLKDIYHMHSFVMLQVRAMEHLAKLWPLWFFMAFTGLVILPLKAIGHWTSNYSTIHKSPDVEFNVHTHHGGYEQKSVLSAYLDNDWFVFRTYTTRHTVHTVSCPEDTKIVFYHLESNNRTLDAQYSCIEDTQYAVPQSSDIMVIGKYTYAIDATFTDKVAMERTKHVKEE